MTDGMDRVFQIGALFAVPFMVVVSMKVGPVVRDVIVGFVYGDGVPSGGAIDNILGFLISFSVLALWIGMLFLIGMWVKGGGRGILR